MENKLFDEMLRVENYHWWFVARRKIINTFIKKMGIRDNSRIFEIGCGNGANLEFLSNHGRITSIEKNEVALANAKNKNIGELYQGELPNGIPEEIDGNFDLIVMLDVLEHIDDDEACLRVLCDYIGDNGKLFITVPAYQNLWSHHDEVHQHKRRYSIPELQKLLEGNGWKISHSSYFNTLLFPLAFIHRKTNSVLSKNDYELTLPSKWLNWLLYNIFSLEQYLIGTISFPFGLSIIICAEHKNK